MNTIGGYFELELNKGPYCYHTTPFTLKSGRSSLRFILEFVKPSLVYVPFYTCHASLASFEEAGVSFRYYEIDQALDPKHLPELKCGEYFLYVNYFDIKRSTVDVLSDKYAERLIVDCAQAFFMKGNGRSWYFNSCRKFFGVPDGSYLYVPDGVVVPQVLERNEAYFVDHLVLRFNGHPAEGYDRFVENEIACGAGVTRMSKLSEYLLSGIPYESIIDRRLGNFNYVHSILGGNNKLRYELDALGVPMCYPYLPQTEIKREELYKENIFIPFFWKDALACNDSDFEKERSLVNKLLPIPIDQRYGISDMKRLINQLNSNHA